MADKVALLDIGQAFSAINGSATETVASTDLASIVSAPIPSSAIYDTPVINIKMSEFANFRTDSNGDVSQAVFYPSIAAERSFAVPTSKPASLQIVAGENNVYFSAGHFSLPAKALSNISGTPFQYLWTQANIIEHGAFTSSKHSAGFMSPIDNKVYRFGEFNGVDGLYRIDTYQGNPTLVVPMSTNGDLDGVNLYKLPNGDLFVGVHENRVGSLDRFFYGKQAVDGTWSGLTSAVTTGATGTVSSGPPNTVITPNTTRTGVQRVITSQLNGSGFTNYYYEDFDSNGLPLTSSNSSLNAYIYPDSDKLFEGSNDSFTSISFDPVALSMEVFINGVSIGASPSNSAALDVPINSTELILRQKYNYPFNLAVLPVVPVLAPISSTFQLIF